MSPHRPTRRRLAKWLLTAGGTAAVGAVFLLPRKANAYYAGPASDHFDGHAFFNPGGRKPKGLVQLARMYATDTFAPWPSEPQAITADRPPQAVPGPTARIVHIGHASWLIQSAGLNVLIDPVWSERASPVSFAGPKRVNAPGIAFDDLPRIDAVLVTHNHYDHLDLPTLARLWQRHRPRIVTPLGNDRIMRAEISGIEAQTLDWGQAAELSPTIRVHAEPTLHWSARGARDRMHALWASFVIETPAGKIYAIGDTGFGDGRTFRHIRARHPKLALALIPIGAYEPRWFMADQHINPTEAVAVMEAVDAPRALGHHWGTFPLTAEAHDQPPKDLAQALAARGHAPERFRAAQPGMVSTI
ncbi:MAG: MBL fold metallo-hydrolase [Hyphomicrobiaceae bacterium]